MFATAFIQGASKIHGQTSRMSSSDQNKEKVCINISLKMSGF
jgi:hypothetical protein